MAMAIRDKTTPIPSIAKRQPRIRRIRNFPRVTPSEIGKDIFISYSPTVGFQCRSFQRSGPKLTPSQRQRVGKITAMGEGDIDYKAVFAQAAQAGLKYFVIEQDTAGQGGRDAVEDCRIAYDNLSKIL